jgi:hypothetical protein
MFMFLVLLINPTTRTVREDKQNNFPLGQAARHTTLQTTFLLVHHTLGLEDRLPLE